MAGKTSSMIVIKQLLLMHQQGQAIKAIARNLGVSKNTVKDYLHKVQHLISTSTQELTISTLLTMADPELEHLLHAGNPAYTDVRYTHIEDKLAYYKAELSKVGVTRLLLWEEYKVQVPDGYSYAQFSYHLKRLLDSKATPSMVLQHTPGDKLLIDFAGAKLHYIDRRTSQPVEVEVFVGCLAFSDYCYVEAVPSQRIADFTSALANCLHALGGVPLAVVSDNLKAAVVKSHRYEPDINATLQQLANHYGTTIVPTRAYKPKDKGAVENQVKIIYTRVYARLRHYTFHSLEALNTAIKACVASHNQTRMQRKPYSRQEHFLAHEKALLKPLPEEKFEFKYYYDLKVAANNHVYLATDRHYYSVPFQYIGQYVKVICTRTMVSIYCQGNQVAMHIRNYQQGTYTTDAQHLCSQHQHYQSRSPKYYLDIALKRSAYLHSFFEHIFQQDRYPEQLYRTCDGLLSLQRKAEPTQFDQACRLAMEHRQYSYHFVQRILQNGMAKLATEEPTEPPPLPTHSNIRGKEYYQAQILFSNQ